MKGDFTRFSHQPRGGYAGVLMQQGRVTLDADWNEQFEIDDHRLRVQTVDTIGRACAPANDAGFEISFTPDGGDLIIGEGRIYVDGMLVENRHGSWVRVVEFTDSRVVPSDIAPDGTRLEAGEWIEVGWDDAEAGSGATIGRITEVDDESIAADFFEPPDAALENLRVRRLVTYLTQPFYRAEAEPPFAEPFTPGEWEGQRHLVYLDVWRRHVTALEDPRIREVALGGPDTATRVQTAWAVRLLFDGERPFDATGMACHDQINLWGELTAPKAARMSARAEAAPEPDDPCEIRPEAGYRGLENRLYRVEIHDPGPLGTATYKWSRDNGSILASITGFPDTDEIQVHSLGKDRVLRFGAGDPVEVFSDETEMAALPGILTAVSGQPDEAERVITVDDDVSVFQNHHTPRARRWDGGPTTTSDTFELLEDGVQVRFSGGPFQSGDYWVIPARVATGDVEGFVDAVPRGCFHHLAHLALVTWSQDVGDVDAPLTFTTTDCRHTFPSLCELPTGGQGCATVTVGDGVASVGDFTSIQDAVDAVPAEGPAHVSILPGEYVVDSPVRITRARLTIAGCDDRTVVRSPQGPVFRLDRCSEVRLERMRVVAADSTGAAVIVSSTEVTLQRCTVINGTPRRTTDDLTHLTTADLRSTLRASIDPSGPAVAVHASALVWILDNHLLGNPGASIQADLTRCSGNAMRLGGVWIRDGSRWVTVTGNELLGGPGPGIALGGLAPDERPSRRFTGVRQIDICHNRIASMGQAGITTVTGVSLEGEDVVAVSFERFVALAVEDTVTRLRTEFADRSSFLVRPEIVGLSDLRLPPVAALGDIEEVTIASNRISRCGRQALDPFFDDQATGGIVLREVTDIRILDNEILDNGVRGRAAGIFLAGCDSTEVSGNRIRGNGSDGGVHADLAVSRTTQGPNPLIVRGIEFELDQASQSLRMPVFGLLVQHGLQVRLPDPVEEACFTYFSLEPVDLVARSQDGSSVFEQVLESGIHNFSVDPGFDFVVLQMHPRDSGGSDQLAVMSLVQFCAGRDCRRYQGGVIGIDLAGEDGRPAAALHGNEVEAPAGQALLITGVGPVLAADNRLRSRGSTVQCCALAGSLGEGFPMSLLPRTVLIYDAGQSAALGNRNLAAGGGLASRGSVPSGVGTGSLGGGLMFERNANETDTVLIDDLAAPRGRREPDGPVSFHGNLVGYQAAGEEFVPATLAIGSFDDVGVNDNHIEAEAPGGMILIDVFVTGLAVRAADNAIKEPPRNAFLSGRLSGLLAHVTGNQATHCIAVVAPARVSDNQITMEQVSSEYRCGRLGTALHTMSAFSVGTGES